MKEKLAIFGGEKSFNLEVESYNSIGDEEVLAAQFDKPVMVHSWPHETKAFYIYSIIYLFN